jgi:hypothetical protein
MMVKILEPYEKPCPDCQGTGYLNNEGKSWVGRLTSTRITPRTTTHAGTQTVRTE